VKIVEKRKFKPGRESARNKGIKADQGRDTFNENEIYR